MVKLEKITGKLQVFSKYGSHICEISTNERDYKEESNEANAKLLAAAPELLEACKIAKYWLCGHVSTDCLKGDCVCAWDKLKRAIAKAEGDEDV